MIVVIADEVFAAPTERLALSAVVQLGFEGQHRIQTDPPYSPAMDCAITRWLEGLDQSSREEAQLALETGMDRDALGVPCDLSIRVAKVPSPDWSGTPPCLPVSVALAFLRRPLRVMLENWHNDGAFLRTVPPSPWRQELRSNLDRGWIEIDHGGGSDMKGRLERSTQEEALRLWALFDSDALEPGRPSRAQDALQSCCFRRGIAHHQLQRRAIENYLPIEAIQSWVVLSPRKKQEPRRRTVAAFAAMRPKQRHHYNMKRGFAGDRKGWQEIPALFDDVVAHADLQSGIAEEIADLFHQNRFEIREEWLRKDGQHPETLSMVQSIFRKL